MRASVPFSSVSVGIEDCCLLTLMKKLQQAAGAELVNLDNSTDDTSESGKFEKLFRHCGCSIYMHTIHTGPTTHLANSTVLCFSVKEKKGTLADAVRILGVSDILLSYS